MKRLMLLLTLLLFPLIPAKAQDDSVKVEKVSIGTVEQGRAQNFTILLATGLVVATKYPTIVHDEGGYIDSTFSKDKGIHFIISYALTDVGIKYGVNRWKTATLVCVAGAGFEWVQAFNSWRTQLRGYASSKDMVANCSGAFLNATLDKFRHRD